MQNNIRKHIIVKRKANKLLKNLGTGERGFRSGKIRSEGARGEFQVEECLI